MEFLLADYEAIFSYFHESSNAVSNADYRDLIPLQTEPLKKDLNRQEWSRLIEEIEFLTKHWNPEELTNPLLLVQGAYPGNHYKILSTMFPALEIELWGTQTMFETKRIKIVNENLLETQCNDYQRRDVIFICYLDLPEEASRYEDKYQGFWLNQMTYQTGLLRALKPKLASLSFSLPVSVDGIYYRGYLTPSCLSSPEDDYEDRICRLIPVLDQDKFVRCSYSVDWFEQVLNYWNLAAKKGRLLRNPLNKTSYIVTNSGTLYFGIEICRLIDILHGYLVFCEQIDAQATETIILDQILSLIQAITNQFYDLNIEFSLENYSNRYRPADMVEGLELQPSVPAIARAPLLQSESLAKAKALLMLAEETFEDLTL